MIVIVFFAIRGLGHHECGSLDNVPSNTTSTKLSIKIAADTMDQPSCRPDMAPSDFFESYIQNGRFMRPIFSSSTTWTKVRRRNWRSYEKVLGYFMEITLEAIKSKLIFLVLFTIFWIIFTRNTLFWSENNYNFIYKVTNLSYLIDYLKIWLPLSWLL